MMIDRTPGNNGLRSSRRVVWLRALILGVLAFALVSATIPDIAEAKAPPARQVAQRGGRASVTGLVMTAAGIVVGGISFVVFLNCASTDCTDGTLSASQTLTYGGLGVAWAGVHIMAGGSFWQARGLVRSRERITRGDGQAALGLGITGVMLTMISVYFNANESDLTRITIPIALICLAGTAFFGHRQHIVNGNWSFLSLGQADPVEPTTQFAVAPYFDPRGGAGVSLGLTF